MASTFALIGPQGIGKSRAGLRIAAALGIAHVVDDYTVEDGLPDNALIITNNGVPRLDGWEDVVEIRVTSSTALDALVRALERAAASTFPAA